MGFLNSIKKGFSSVGSGLSKAFGVVTAPVKEVWGVLKDTVHTVAHTPEKVLKSIDKATGVVGGLGNNVEHSVASAAGAVESVGDNAAAVAKSGAGALGGLGRDTNDLASQPIMWGALALGALMLLRT